MMSPDHVACVTVPAHGAELWIYEAIASTSNQTHPQLDVIVVDDGSSDDTVAWLYACSDERVQVIEQPNSGACAVRNRARATAIHLAKKKTARRVKRVNNVADAVWEYPELAVLIDGTEQPKRRPTDKQKRNDHYSGKKKRHTLKQIVTTTPGGLILDQSPAVGGRRHDFRAFKEHVAYAGTAVQTSFERLRVVCTTDSGFSGIDKLSLPVTTQVVERARRGPPAHAGAALTPEQKALNRVRSRTRIRVEHAIGYRKQYRVASEIHRNADETYGAAMAVVARLVNVRAYDRIETQTGLDLLAVAL